MGTSVQFRRWCKTGGSGWPFPMALAICLALFSGCRSTEVGTAKAGGPERHFVRGNVVAVDVPAQSVTLAHEAVPGFMPAMTMDYKVVDPAAIGELHQGDRITADLLNDRDAAGPKDLRLANVVVIAQARPDSLPPVQYHVPEPGQVVPDFTLLNQSDKKIS